MIICPNCGAEIDKEVDKCPYCSYINMEGAKKKYNADYNAVKEQIVEAKKEPGKALRKGFKGGIKVIVITVVVLLVLVLLFVLELNREMKNHPKEFLTPEEQAYAAAYKVVAGEQLEAAYEDKNIAELARIFDKAYSEDRVSLWGDPHYETGYAASCYMKLQNALPNLDKEKMKKTEAEEITYYCFYFYYKAYGDDGAVLFDPIRDSEILPIIENRLGFTTEDMENFASKVKGHLDFNINRSSVYKVTKKYFKNYH